MLRLFLEKGKQDEESGERVLLQYDIVIMYSILFIFIIILKMQFLTWFGMLACMFGIVFYTLNEYMTHRFYSI